MSVVIKSDEKKEWQLSDSIGGDDHDHCPSCDTDVEPNTGFGGEYGTPLMWRQYSHSQLDGGCGAAWTRTTKQGLERNDSRGARTKWLTSSATRTFSVGSPAYESGWERIFGNSATTVKVEKEAN